MRFAASRRPGASPNATVAAARHAGRGARGKCPSPSRSRPGGALSQLDQLRRNGYRRRGLVLVFAVLTAYHTIGGGALTEPYGDLVIFFVPPIFVIAGVVVVLIGMYVQWIRWRMHKPLSFARYPKWDLNLAAERKALLACCDRSAQSSPFPRFMGGHQAYLYTDAVSFCGAVLPLHDSGVRHLSAVAACARGLRAMPRRTRRTGYIESKVRGMMELVETIQDDFPRPIPVPVVSLRPIRGNCEQCHWPANFFGGARSASDALPGRRAEHALGDRHAGPGRRRWRLGDASRMGIHWHVAGKVEYVASDAERQNITWVRSVDPKTGAAKVYTSQAQPPTRRAAGEIRTMDCVDCHNRPSHILQAPDRSVDVALADGRIDPSLPFIKQQGVAALTASYANREQAMRGIDSSLRGYYQKTTLRYTPASSRRSRRHRAPAEHLRPLFLPGDESPVGHICHQRHALLFRRVLPLPRRPA
jgi:hypothetical protein